MPKFWKAYFLKGKVYDLFQNKSSPAEHKTLLGKTYFRWLSNIKLFVFI